MTVRPDAIDAPAERRRRTPTPSLSLACAADTNHREGVWEPTERADLYDVIRGNLKVSPKATARA